VHNHIKLRQMHNTMVILPNVTCICFAPSEMCKDVFYSCETACHGEVAGTPGLHSEVSGWDFTPDTFWPHCIYFIFH